MKTRMIAMLMKEVSSSKVAQDNKEGRAKNLKCRDNYSNNNSLDRDSNNISKKSQKRKKMIMVMRALNNSNNHNNKDHNRR